MNIVPLPRPQWEGYTFPFDYDSDAYYDVRMEATEDGFLAALVRTPLETPFQREAQDQLYNQGGDDPAAYGIFDGDMPVALLEVTPEVWNNRFRITHIWVMRAYRGKGHGKLLMRHAQTLAEARQARALVLETQSSNARAIGFYLSQGFVFAGLDAYAYTNCDIARREVRLEMVKVLG